MGNATSIADQPSGISPEAFEALRNEYEAQKKVEPVLTGWINTKYCLSIRISCLILCCCWFYFNQMSNYLITWRSFTKVFLPQKRSRQRRQPPSLWEFEASLIVYTSIMMLSSFYLPPLIYPIRMDNFKQFYWTISKISQHFWKFNYFNFYNRFHHKWYFLCHWFPYDRTNMNTYLPHLPTTIYHHIDYN